MRVVWSLVVAGVAQASSPSSLSPALEEQFSAWARRHNKHYSSEKSRQLAQTAFEGNLRAVSALNSRPNATWVASVENQFGDMTPEEFRETILARPRDTSRRSPDMWKNEESFPVVKRKGLQYLKKNSVKEGDESFDWTDHGAVTRVQDQGSVGTCWAFSTIGNIEGQWYLSSEENELVDLSEEYLVDCDGSRDDEAGRADCGVFGGWPYLAYQFLIDAGGVPTEETNPYCCGTGDCYPCMNGPISLCGPPPYYCDEEITAACPNAELYASISDWHYISNNEDDMKDDLQQIGPLSALLDATQLQYYQSGVWEGKSYGPDAAGCSKTSLNHAVVVTGYGVQQTSSGSTTSYWRVKNSWGTRWGEDGYFKILRGEGMCGINTEVTTSSV